MGINFTACLMLNWLTSLLVLYELEVLNHHYKSITEVKPYSSALEFHIIHTSYASYHSSYI
jgi:hypothetical protein